MNNYDPAISVMLKEDGVCQKGIQESIVLNKLYYWQITKLEEYLSGRRKCFRHFYHGKIFIYKSAKELREELFPTLSQKTVEEMLQRFEDYGYIYRITSANKLKGDRTYWYSLCFSKIPENKFELAERRTTGSKKIISDTDIPWGNNLGESDISRLKEIYFRLEQLHGSKFANAWADEIHLDYQAEETSV